MSEQSSEAILLAKAAQDNTLPDTLSLGVDESYELALTFWRDAKYGAARAMVWPFTRPKTARSVDVVVGMTNMLAVIDWADREYDRAVRTLESVAPLVRTLSDRVLQGKYFNSHALCEKARGNYDRAFAYYRDALDCYTLAGAKKNANDVDANIGNLLVHVGQPEAAGVFITRALQSCDDSLAKAQILDMRARQELAFGHFDEARELLRRSRSILCELEASGEAVAKFLAECARTAHAIDVAEVASMERSFSGVIQGRH